LNPVGIKISRRVILAPGRISFFYLSFTYVLFLLSPLSADVPDLFILTAFIMINYLSFLLGTVTTSIEMSRKTFGFREIRSRLTKSQKILIVIGSIYLVAWGISSTMNFGVTSISDLLNKVLSPGGSYQEKFDHYNRMQDANFVSRPMQIMTIFSLIYAAVVPFGAYSWSMMSPIQRGLFVFGISFYVLSYLAIGTMKGIGDIIIFIVVGVLARRGSLHVFKMTMTKKLRRRMKKREIIARLTVFLIFSAGFVYMVSLQISRAQVFGIVFSPAVGDISNSLISSIFEREVAFGIHLVLAYPSHGYFGLSQSLSQPFEFSYGAGFFPALESYRLQYFGGESFESLVYLFRAERATGWPAGMYWSTVFPWVASDISFFGTPFLMFGLGWLLTRVWVSSILTGSALSLAALGQLAIAIAFIPANNQVFSSRLGLWTVCSLIVIWFIKELQKNRQSQ
jgi:hypothetical protein